MRKNKNIGSESKKSIATANAANLTTEQNDDSAFSQALIRLKEHPDSRKNIPKKP